MTRAPLAHPDESLDEFLVEPNATAPWRRRVLHAVRHWPWLLATVTAVVYSAIGIVRFRRFEFTSFDLSIFTQVVSSWAHADLPVSTVRGGPGFAVLGDHFNPALAALSPAYAIAPDPVTLLVAQAVLFGVSVVPIARLAERRLGRGAAGCTAVAYVLSWGLQNAVVVDFHEVALVVPLLTAGLCAMVDGRWRSACWWLVPMLLVKEDLGATVAVAGLIMMARRGRRSGLALIIAGATASLLEIFVLIPWARGSGGYAYSSSVTDGSVREILASLLVPTEKLETVALLFGITAFVCLRSSLSWLVLPTLLWRFASDTPNYWGHEWHYNAVLMPIVFVAVIEGLSKLRAGRRGAAFASHVPAIMLTIAVLAVHVAPLGNFLTAEAWTSTDRSRAAVAVAAVALVPRGSVVKTDIGLMSHLTAGRETYFCGNNTRTVRADWFITDQAVWGQPMSGTKTLDYARTVHPNQQFRIVYDRAGITVLRADDQAAR